MAKFCSRQKTFLSRQKRFVRENALLRQLARLFQIEIFWASSEKLTASQLALLELKPSVTQGEVERKAALPEGEKAALNPPQTEKRKKKEEKGRPSSLAPGLSFDAQTQGAYHCVFPLRSATASFAEGRRVSLFMSRASA